MENYNPHKQLRKIKKAVSKIENPVILFEMNKKARELMLEIEQINKKNVLR